MFICCPVFNAVENAKQNAALDASLIVCLPRHSIPLVLVGTVDVAAETVSSGNNTVATGRALA